MINIVDIVCLCIGFIIGAFIVIIVYKNNMKFLYSELTLNKNQLLEKTNEILLLSEQISTCKANLNNQEMLNKVQNDNLETLKNQFKFEFENLANRIFNETTNKSNEQNRLGLMHALSPLTEKIKDFEHKIYALYDSENKERYSLMLQIENLAKLNQQMSTEANQLTKALRGDNKIQGNWGEMVLERLLQYSGLIEGQEYVLQNTLKDHQGNVFRPDVIVNLPDNRSLIIDSKVSLTAFAFIESNENFDENIKNHIQSIRSHIKLLSKKNYQTLYQLKTVDFVLMFIPIEGAFTVAVKYDHEIIEDALKNNIIIVCPTTLLAAMKTVHNVWRSEKSIRNSQEIAKIGGQLHDRLVDFLLEFKKIEVAIHQTKKNYDSALTKLEGHQGMIKSALKLKEFGSNSSKLIGDEWVNIANCSQ